MQKLSKITDDIRRGGTVKLTQPSSGEESARYVVTEWNGDRGFGRLVCTLPIPPIELLRAGDVEVVTKAK